MRASVICPTPASVACGRLWGLSGATLPAVVDQPLHLLAPAFGPLALMMLSGGMLLMARLTG
ncbi:MAG: hypothetical protein ACUVVU_05175 [Tepidimonas sp.]|uniref:hypothetical protein n=1 Tax=Tepidimonas sp. TaxID=2002775 RepID=UPI004054F3B4